MQVNDIDILNAILRRRATSIWLTEGHAEKIGYTFVRLDTGWFIKKTTHGREEFAGQQMEFYFSHYFSDPFPDDYIARLALAKYFERKNKMRKLINEL